MQFGINKHEKIFSKTNKIARTRRAMAEQKERTRITHSGENCAMNCAIQGGALDLKTKDLIGQL